MAGSDGGDIVEGAIAGSPPAVLAPGGRPWRRRPRRQRRERPRAQLSEDVEQQVRERLYGRPSGRVELSTGLRRGRR